MSLTLDFLVPEADIAEAPPLRGAADSADASLNKLREALAEQPEPPVVERARENDREPHYDPELWQRMFGFWG